MNSLMTTLQQPLSVAALAHCLGFGSHPARPAVQRRSRSLRDSRQRALAAAKTLHEPGLDDNAPAGCGWFDSSHELHQGLVVMEHSGVEGLAAELPVTVWLQLALDGAARASGADNGPWRPLRA